MPENFIDPIDRITTDCAADTGNQFVITGRGGLPEDPSQTLRGRTVWQDLRPLEATQPETARSRELATVNPQSQLSTPNQQLITNQQRPTRLVEATGWAINADGQVELVELDAYPGVTPHSSWFKAAECRTSNSTQPS